MGFEPTRKKPAPAAPAPMEELNKPIFPVVGVGASAGGLEAFRELLRALPPDVDAAFVLVQHLDPAHKSILAELLARETRMAVVEASDRLELSPGSVYVIPAGKDMTVESGLLRLAARPREGPHLPIDLFLTSLARDRRDKAIAVILSGTASDGAAGVVAIRAEGGVTLAQEPASAKYSGMPESAIATGAVDLVLPIPALAEQLVSVAGHGRLRPGTGEDAEALVRPEDPLLADLLALLQAVTSADFGNYRQGTVLRRITRRMMLARCGNLEEYLDLLRRDRAEVEALYQDILIRVTSFFREPQVFETLKETYFPQMAGARPGEPARFWVPGCSTGEEAYSLAIAWAEVQGGIPLTNSDLQVFASDINQQVVDKARAGIYPASIAADVSRERLERFFTPVAEGYQIAKEIREVCVFARHDITRDPPFSKLDLVSLRNVLIYLGPLLQRRVIPLLHFALRPGGFLLLGESESVGAYTDLFSLAQRKSKIYLRREGKATLVPSAALSPEPAGPQPRLGREPSRAEFELTKEVDRLLLETYAPVGVVVDADFQIKQFRGRPGQYLELGPGRASLDLVHLARDGLATELRSALREATRGQAPLRRSGIRVFRDKRIVAVGFDILPIKSPSGELSFLVLFHDAPVGGEQPAPEPPPPGTRAKGASARAAGLERELSELKEYARAVLEDKESANEELRSANEELQSANEELQSLNEEMDATSEEVKSANEELRTVNDEMHSMNDRLAKVNDELQVKNVLLRETNDRLEHRERELRDARGYAEAVVNTVREPLLVLDHDLRVASASKSFYHTFKTDAKATVGRPFFDLGAGQWDVPELREALAGVSPTSGDFQDLTVSLNFPHLGPRTMLLSGRRIRLLAEGVENVLLAMDDITGRADAEKDRARAFEDQRISFQLLQATVLDTPEQLTQVRFGHAYLSATQEGLVGGDFYDVFEAKDGHIALLIGDVSGHGVEAARIAMLVKDIIHAFAHRSREPRTVLRHANDLLLEKNTPGFVTLFLGVLDPEDGVLTYASAGHPSAALRSQGGKLRFLDAFAPPLGVFPHHRWKQDQVRLHRDDLLLLYTDGVIEARRGGEFLGEEGLVKLLNANVSEPLDCLPQALVEGVVAFSGGALTDDAAVLAVMLAEGPELGEMATR